MEKSFLHENKFEQFKNEDYQHKTIKMKNKIFEIINKQLINTVNKCKFKKAFIPNGWTCINIDEFSNELSNILAKEIFNNE